LQGVMIELRVLQLEVVVVDLVLEEGFERLVFHFEHLVFLELLGLPLILRLFVVG